MSKLANPKPRDFTSQELNDQELRYILTLISTSKFDGKDVFVVADIVDKLNKKIEFNHNEVRSKRG